MKLIDLPKVGLVALAAASMPALAESELSYSFIEAVYIDTEIDERNFDVEGDGLGLSGSVELGDNFFMRAGFANQDFDGGIDTEQRTIGFGAHTAIADKTDLFATLDYVDIENDTRFGSFDADGYGIGIGIRSMVLEGLELNGGVNYVDLGDGGDGASISLGARYYVVDNLSLGAGVQLDDDVTSWTAGIRLDF